MAEYLKKTWLETFHKIGLKLYTVVAEEEVEERARRAAAAARRWREYSRRGADKAPTFKLPEAVSNNEN